MGEAQENIRIAIVGEDKVSGRVAGRCRPLASAAAPPHRSAVAAR
jgi:hypothetical protein